MADQVEGTEVQETVDPAASGAEGSAQPTAQEIIDLDKAEKFKFGGREWTPKEFQGAYMMQSDYTRKTQAIAEERKFYDNLSSDLSAVKSNPQLVEEFKRVYPEKFHAYLEHVTPTQPKPQQTGANPELEQRLNRVEQYYQEQTQKAIDAEVTSKCDALNKKYPDVAPAEDFALSKLQGILADKRKNDPKAKLTEEDWDTAWKATDQIVASIAKGKLSKKVTEQTKANDKGKDVAAGGGTPGMAPRVGKSIKEQTRLLHESGALNEI